MSLAKLLHTWDEEKKIVKTPVGYVERDKDEVSLKGILQRKRLKYMREKAAPRKGVSFAPHAATFPYCKRLKVAQLAGLVDIYYEKTTPRVQTGMDIGTQLHDLVQNYFWEVGMLKGTFECLKCDKSYDNLIAPIECPSGKKTHKRKHLRYREVIARNEEYSLYGRSDGILVIDDLDRLLEIKSLTAKPYKNHNEYQFYFDDLDKKGPKEPHIIQLTLYMFMLDIHIGHLLYISKNDGQIKTFEIKYDESLIRPFLDEVMLLKQLAEDLKQGKQVILPPPCKDSKCNCHTTIAP